MTKIISKSAFSLLELIIASVLVVIVILGIFSINSVLNNNSQDYGQRYYVRSETQTTLNHILNNASFAIGSGTNISPTVADQGIVKGNDANEGWGDGNSFCIHQDIPFGQPNDSNAFNLSPGTPPNYPNSRWLCYTWIPASYQINYCVSAYNSASLPSRGAAGCTGNLNFLYLGTATIFPNNLGSNFDQGINYIPTSGLFSITINNCLDDTAASCSTGVSTDQVNNPSVQLSGSVYPSQQGSQQQ